MAMYEDAAVDAATALAALPAPPTDAVIRAEWKKAVYAHSPTRSKNSAEKPCPREAFMGLCKSGHIKGIAPIAGYAPAPASNAGRAVAAAVLLTSPSASSYTTKAALWGAVCPAGQQLNCQLDVVVGLDSAALLR